MVESRYYYSSISTSKVNQFFAFNTVVRESFHYIFHLFCRGWNIW